LKTTIAVKSLYNSRTSGNIARVSYTICLRESESTCGL